ncbi:MAG TPA: fibronectin type III domain-containing protein [Gaiellaceae bacterium]|nr:fibronectin type III domain-containing protein [Gaiellaceae bacterium]
MVLGLAALVAVALVSSSSGQAQGPPGGSPPGLEKAIAAKQKHADRMLDKPGVAGIGVALNGAGKPVIRIYKEKQDVADLPAELEGVPVDSVTTGIIEPRDHSPSHRFPRPVPIGVSAGLSGVATGTLGVRVTDGTNVYALSNNHVFAGINGASIGDAIISPGDVDGGIDPDDIIGTLAAYEAIDFDGGDNTMDAAIALTSPANVATSTPADGYGTPSPVTAPAFLGQAVQKYGRTTGLQLGNVAGTDLTVDVCYLVLFEFCLQEARFVGQISVSPGPFSAPGDSGSLIVTQGGNQPVALLFAGGDGLTIGSPIDAVLQRFGVTIDGSTPPPGPPGAPTSLAASPGDASASLSWNAPSFTGGSPVTGYRVYRGTSPNPTTALTPDLGVQTTYADTGLVNGTTYYYKVSALNANGEGPLSGQAQATPTAVVPPSAPLAILDNFDDGFENPLSDQGRWSNGVSGGEVGLYVPSVWLACSIATTCTGWRNTGQYGPDSEVYARLSVLPGDSNQLRLYARLQQPGTSTYDAYMLRTTQLSGTDQVSLERVDNGTIVTLLTINQELVAGDLLLLRVQGQVLEAWLNRSGWSRIGVVADATYGAAGYVGVGLRGTTGRADDFGARTMGASPPPDTTPPSAPGTLTASASSSTQIDLAWGAATDDSGTVAQYLIERCSGSPCTFAQIATVGGAVTSYSNTGLSPSTAYSYRVRAQDGAPVPNVGPYSNTAGASTQAAPRPLYFSLLSDGTVGGLSVANEDVVFFDGVTTFGLAFDGSDVGVTSFRIDAFSWVSATSLLLSFDTAGAIPGITGTVDDSDLVLFTATSVGTTTAGTFTLYFDGSDVGLTTNAEDVDAVELLANGHILVSTTAAVSVPGFSGDDKDLLEFTPTSLGAVTAGTFSLYFDGSDVGLATSAENIDAAAVDASGRIYLSTVGNFSVPGVSGGDEDVFVFTPTTLGTNTTGTYSATLYFDGSAFGLAANDVYAIDLPAGT